MITLNLQNADVDATILSLQCCFIIYTLLHIILCDASIALLSLIRSLDEVHHLLACYADELRYKVRGSIVTEKWRDRCHKEIPFSA